MTDQTPSVPTPEPQQQAPTPDLTPAPEPAPAPAPATPVDPMQQKMTGGEMAGTIIGGILLGFTVPFTLWMAWNSIFPQKAKQAMIVFWAILAFDILAICCVFAFYGAIIGSALNSFSNYNNYGGSW